MAHKDTIVDWPFTWNMCSLDIAYVEFHLRPDYLIWGLFILQKNLQNQKYSSDNSAECTFWSGFWCFLKKFNQNLVLWKLQIRFPRNRFHYQNELTNESDSNIKQFCFETSYFRVIFHWKESNESVSDIAFLMYRWIQ